MCTVHSFEIFCTVSMYEMLPLTVATPHLLINSAKTYSYFNCDSNVTITSKKKTNLISLVNVRWLLQSMSRRTDATRKFSKNKGWKLSPTFGISDHWPCNKLVTSWSAPLWVSLISLSKRLIQLRPKRKFFQISDKRKESQKRKQQILAILNCDTKNLQSQDDYLS